MTKKPETCIYHKSCKEHHGISFKYACKPDKCSMYTEKKEGQHEQR